MSDFSDNACEVSTNFSCENQKTEQVNDDYKDDATEIEMLMEKFVALCLKHTETRNRSVFQSINSHQNKSSEILKKKMQLLCGLNTPIGNKMCTVVQVNNMHRQFLEQFHKLYNSEDEYLRAYATHCDEAIKAKKALVESAEFDEYTDMDCYKLVDITDNVRKALHDIENVCADQIVKLKLERKENEANYMSLLKEAELFENYFQMAIETLEQRKFDLDLVR